MGSSFLIGPDTLHVDWSVNHDTFSAAVLKRWARAWRRRRAAAGAHPAAAANLTRQAGDLEPMIIIGLDDEGSTIFVEGGDVARAVDVALWWRTLTPPDAHLLFFDEEYTAQVDLTPHVTAQELARPFDG